MSQPCPSPGVRAGFALPVVILLALVVGIMAAVLLERQGSQRQVVERQLRGYKSHHFERGVREVVGAWTDTLNGQPLSNMLADDGHALDLVLPDGGLASVYMFDGQGSTLVEPTGLTDEEKQDAGGILDALLAITAGNPDPALLRPVGPVKVCLASASPEVLEAIGAYVSEGKAGKRFAQSVLQAREAAELSQADLETAMNAAGITASQRPVMQRIAVLKPELWGVVIDAYEAGRAGSAPPPPVRYLARLVLPGSASARQVTLQSLGKFLSWEEAPVEAPPRH